jgi:RNA polymerase sigma-70 factor (ECF subfamily)
MVADPTEAEVLTQDAFVRAWQKLGSYRFSGPFGAWLRRVSANVVIENRRSRAREARWVEDGVELAHVAAPQRRGESEVAIDLERAVAALPPGARMAFVLHDVYGYQHKEIAALANLATGTIKAQLHRARSLLRGALRSTREA